MILDDIKNINYSLIEDLKKSKTNIEIILNNLPNLDIFKDNSENINIMHLKQVEYYNYHKNLIEFINNITTCDELDNKNIEFQSLIDEFYNILINYMDINTGNYNQMETLLDKTVSILLKDNYNNNNNNNNKVVINNLIQIKNNKLNYYYLKYYNSINDSYKEIISFIEKKIKNIFNIKVNNSLNYI